MILFMQSVKNSVDVASAAHPDIQAAAQHVPANASVRAVAPRACWYFEGTLDMVDDDSARCGEKLTVYPY